MELVDLYDENRIPLGRTVERYTHREPGEYRVVVHVCIFDSRGWMLIQRRAAEKRSWPGLWDVTVGGAVSAGETSRQAAEREVQEELGIPLDLTGRRPSLTVHFDAGFDDFFLLVRDIDLDTLTLQTEEVAEVRWATLEEIEAMVDDGRFIAYPQTFLRFLHDTRGSFGFDL